MHSNCISIYSRNISESPTLAINKSDTNITIRDDYLQHNTHFCTDTNVVTATDIKFNNIATAKSTTKGNSIIICPNPLSLNSYIQIMEHNPTTIGVHTQYVKTKYKQHHAKCIPPSANSANQIMEHKPTTIGVHTQTVTTRYNPADIKYDNHSSNEVTIKASPTCESNNTRNINTDTPYKSTDPHMYVRIDTEYKKDNIKYLIDIPLLYSDLSGTVSTRDDITTANINTFTTQDSRNNSTNRNQTQINKRSDIRNVNRFISHNSKDTKCRQTNAVKLSVITLNDNILPHI